MQKKEEINNSIENDVFESVQNENQRTISYRWIIIEKFNDGKKIVKACLVARGFEEDSSNFTKDSPTCSRECLRLVFATAATMSWDITAIESKRVALKFPSLGDPSKLKVISYSDAKYASFADGSSQGVFIVLLKGENNFVAPISW